jgi:hypothetical protein
MVLPRTSQLLIVYLNSSKMDKRVHEKAGLPQKWGLKFELAAKPPVQISKFSCPASRRRQRGGDHGFALPQQVGDNE